MTEQTVAARRAAPENVKRQLHDAGQCSIAMVDVVSNIAQAVADLTQAVALLAEHQAALGALIRREPEPPIPLADSSGYSSWPR